MRLHLALAVVLLLLPARVAADPDAPHAQNVEDAFVEPVRPMRDRDVDIYLVLGSGSNVSRVMLIYCRVERYACAPAMNMSRIESDAFHAHVAWRPSFFDEVRRVGYNFTIHYVNGTQTQSPTANWPLSQPDLPGDAFYYFYELPPPPAKSPSLGTWLVVLAAAFAAARRRRP